jgi:hypothetical protein
MRLIPLRHAIAGGARSSARVRQVDAATVKAFFHDGASDWDTMRLSYYDARH